MDFYQKFISDKAKEKRKILGAMFFPRNPVLFLDFSKVENLNLYEDFLEGLNAIGLTTLVIFSENEKTAETKLPHGRYLHYFAESDKKYAVKAADFALAFGDNTASFLKEGCVPISQLDGDSTVDYDPLHEKGNGFYFKNPTKWEIFKAIVRALETYQFPYDWENLIRAISKR